MDNLNLSNTTSTFSVAQQNEYIKKWIPKVRRALKSAVRVFSDGKSESFVTRRKGTQTEGKLRDSIKSKASKQLGVVELISFSFERHGVFVHKGVGRGYKMNGSFVVRTAKGSPIRSRVAIPWFNPVLDKFIPELANRVAEINANAALNTANIKIK